VYLLNCASNTVEGNLIGTSASGTTALGNSNNGINLVNAPGNQVGGSSIAARNVISGNGGSGVYLSGSATTGNLVQGNYIGTGTNGSLAIPNTGDGVTVDGAPANTIGGTNAGAGNLLSGNSQGGVGLKNSGANSNLVQGNYIGVNATGTNALGNTLSGITILTGNGNLIGGTTTAARNVISANKLDGVRISTNSVGNMVQGNYIGVDATGTNALGNADDGIYIDSASSSLIGGITPGATNIISGNAINGIFLEWSSAANNVVQGNFIGTAASGTAGLGNGETGIVVWGAPGTTIGGTTAGAGNLISANGWNGITLWTSGATGNLIQGNKIGTDVTGMLALRNMYNGIYVEMGPTNTIGGVIPGAGNLISGNGTDGICMTNTSWNVIQGNFIGTAIDGVSDLGNYYHAVECTNASNNLIGGSNSGAGNRLAFSQTHSGSGYAGARIRGGSTNDAVLGNAIFSNGGLGIDLGSYGVNANVNCDTGSGDNMAQNYPVLSNAVSGNGTGISGSLNSRPNATFLLQFFANPICGSSIFGNNGQGQIYLGQTNVVTGNDCNVSFVAYLPGSVPVGYVVTATATDSDNNTSEFSACVPVALVPTLTVVPAINHQVNIAWTNTAAGFVLEQTGSLSPPIKWTTVTNNPVVINGQFVVTRPAATGNCFYVLSFQ
jgi:titin